MIRFGICGAGRIAHTFAKAIKATSGHALAIASRDLSRAQAFQKEYGMDKAYGSYQAMFEDAEIDVIYLATPHGLHYDQMMMALDFGKALLTEKAFTLNAKQAAQVFAKARAKNLFVMEAMWTRFLPITQALLNRVNSGVIGPVNQVSATFSFEGDLDEKGRLMNPLLGGGALLDVGIYPLTYADLFGTVQGAIEASHKRSVTGVDLWNKVTIHTPTFKAVIESGFLENKPRHATIIGTKGRIEVPMFWAAEEAFITDAKGSIMEHLSFPHPVNGFEYEIQAVIDDLEANRKENAVMPPSKTLEMLAVMDDWRARWNVVYPGEKITS